MLDDWPLSPCSESGCGRSISSSWPATRHGVGDWYFYHWQAQAIVQGHGFIDPWILLGTHQYRPSAIHPPLYPLLLSGVYALGGHSALDQRSLGLVLGTITLVLVGLLGKRVGGPRLGLIAAFLYAVYPLMIAVDGDLMSETLYGPLIAGTLLTSFAVIDRPNAWRAIGLGALIGLAALTRSEALLFIPFLVLPIAYRARSDWRGRGMLAIVAIAGCVVVLTPWTIRNENVFGRFVPVSTNDATVLAGANCNSTYHGVDLGGWDITCVRPRTTTNEAAQAAIWRRDGLNYARHHITRLPLVVAIRELRVWDLWQPLRQARNFAEGRLRWVEEAGVAVYYGLMLLAIAGVFALRRRTTFGAARVARAGGRRLHLDGHRLRRAASAPHVRDPTPRPRRGRHHRGPGASRRPPELRRAAIARDHRDARGMTSSRFRRALIAIAVGGLVLRVIYAYAIVKSRPLIGDALEFQQQANLLADGHGYIQVFPWYFSHISRPTADKPPLYPLLEAIPSLFGGRNWAWHDLVDILGGTALIGVVGLLGRRVAGARAGNHRRGHRRPLPAAHRRGRVAAQRDDLRAARDARRCSSPSGVATGRRRGAPPRSGRSSASPR